MAHTDMVTVHLHGMYHDVLRDAVGRVLWDSGRKPNTIVADCRRLLAGFMRGTPTTVAGIQGLQVGAGLSAWDQPPGPPPPSSAQSALVDPNPFTVSLASQQIAYLQPGSETVSVTPTNRVRIIATLGPGVPPWPDGLPQHPAPTLREFGLVARLGATPVLINYVTHPAIVKDPTSTLNRTIWLVF
jgi:hypothetical protein